MKTMHSQQQQHPAYRFRAVIEQHPRLHMLGYGPAPYNSPVDVSAQRAELQTPHALSQAAASLQWIEKRLQPCNPNRRRLPSSYTAKHIMQAETGQYVMNGPFILAALTAGLSLTRHYNPRVHAALRPATAAGKDQGK